VRKEAVQAFVAPAFDIELARDGLCRGLDWSFGALAGLGDFGRFVGLGAGSLDWVLRHFAFLHTRDRGNGCR